jgi:regulator of sigma E protease
MASFLIFIIALSVLILIHELGHFLAAKKFKIYVYEFGLGYPPKIFGKKFGETIYSLNLLPIGGFVRILETLSEPLVKKKTVTKGRALATKPIWVRFLVMISGILMNLFLAILIFSVVYGILGIPQKTDKVRIIDTSQSSPALESGISSGDYILAVEGVRVDDTEKLIEEIDKSLDRKTMLVVAREKSISPDSDWKKTDCSTPVEGADCFIVETVPRQNPPPGEGPLGIAISDTKITKPVWWQMPFLGIKAGFEEAFFWGGTIVSGLAEMFANLFNGQVPKDVAGPVGIYQVTDSIRKESGPLAVLHFFGVLSVNLAIINLLPFPALDGSRILFLFWEGVTKKRIKPEIEQKILSVGMMVLIFFFVLITIGDVKRLIQR